MKKLNVLLHLVLSLLLVMATSSCLKPQQPTDEVKNKNHDEVKKVKLILFDCHFHGLDCHATQEIPSLKYLKREQMMVLEDMPDKGWTIKEEGVKKFVVMGGLLKGKEAKDIIDPKERKLTDKSFNPSQVNMSPRQYALIIQLYNAKGEDITGQFATNGEDRIHQFFFTAKGIRPTKYGKEELSMKDGDYRYLYYYYFDTNPWNKPIYKNQATFTGISNPIGLKGYMEFFVPHSECDLQIKLLHARTSKFNSNGDTSPFYSPSLAQSLNDAVDINFKVPIIVCADHNEIDQITGSLQDYKNNPTLLAYLEKLADAYSITISEVIADLEIILNDDSNHSLETGRHL